MIRCAEVIHGWLGWCPNTHVLNVQAPAASTGTGQTDTTDRESPWPGILPGSLEVPHWMTAVALVILFATCFVGGNIWWPVFVSGVLVIFFIIHIRTLKNTGDGR